jgi:integrase
MPTVNLTDRKIASLRPKEHLIAFFDKKTPGFGIRISTEGTKTWFVMYRLAGIRRRLRLGRYPEVPLVEARKNARLALSAVAEGKDPLLEKKAKEAQLKRERLEAWRFDQLCDQYVEQWAKPHLREKTFIEYRRIIDKHLIPEFGKLNISDIEPSYVGAFLRDMGSRKRVLANRTRAVMGAVFRWAIDQKIVAPDINPVSGIRRPGGAEKPKERILNDEELKSVWQCLENETSQVKDVLQLILLTAQRPGEVMGMQWDEIDTATTVWDLPGSRTKNGKAHVVPLSPQAMRIIERQRDSLELLREKRIQRGDSVPGTTPFVFPNRYLEKMDKSPIKMLRKCVKRVVTTLGMKSFAPHDLRRTTATYLGKMEVPGFVIALILNHALPGITNKVYNRYDYLKEKRDALNKWGARVHQVVTGMKLADRQGTAEA